VTHNVINIDKSSSVDLNAYILKQHLFAPQQ